jgi:hypothetical protein
MLVGHVVLGRSSVAAYSELQTPSSPVPSRSRRAMAHARFRTRDRVLVALTLARANNRTSVPTTSPVAQVVTRDREQNTRVSRPLTSVCHRDDARYVCRALRGRATTICACDLPSPLIGCGSSGIKVAPVRARMSELAPVNFPRPTGFVLGLGEGNWGAGGRLLLPEEGSAERRSSARSALLRRRESARHVRDSSNDTDDRC